MKINGYSILEVVAIVLVFQAIAFAGYIGLEMFSEWWFHLNGH